MMICPVHQARWRKAKRKRIRKRRARGKKAVDRGPFGGGEAISLDGSSSKHSEESDFRDAPTSHKKDAQLEYSQKHPGRLTSRLLVRCKICLHGRPSTGRGDNPGTGASGERRAEDALTERTQDLSGGGAGRRPIS